MESSASALDNRSAFDRFLAATRGVFGEERDAGKRWQQIVPLLRELLRDPRLREQSRNWPACVQAERAQNLLFYEDPDYGFVVNGLIKNPRIRTQIHDHAHNWTLYGVLDGEETIERYERLDDASRPGYADICQSGKFAVGPGDVDLVAPFQIHAEQSGDERTVAVIVRAEKPGSFLQGRYDPVNKKYWQGYGPVQIPYELE
jgi:predicted metal-dependent enzyme (double-stranded beta helix superfamily)